MSQKFYKGRTNQHLTWVMVDSTDFATPESAMSAATKIKIYGKLRGATGVNFVSSGTGSLTNDIQHVGASVLGIYTIALAKADLSDASAAWYDQYIISLSATGAAFQTLVVDGGIDDSTLLSRVLLAQSMASDAASAAQQANSRVLIVQSQASDAYSAIIAPLASMTSDVASAVWAHAIGARVDSRILVNKSTISDVWSMLSDVQSDFQSRVPKLVATNSQLSDLASDLRSYLVVLSGVQSDIYSALSDFQSDFQSRVPKRVATDSQLSDLASDIKSAIAAIAVSVSASDISDIASAVRAALVSDLSDILSAAVQTNSRALVIQSIVSDVQSQVSDLQSDFQSRVPKLVATNSQVSDLLSDLGSDLRSFIAAGVPVDASSMSDLRSAIAANVPTLSASDISDIASAVLAGAGPLSASDISNIASAVKVALTPQLSDIYSLLSDVSSHVGALHDFDPTVDEVLANVKKVNDVTLQGDGNGTPWGPV